MKTVRKPRRRPAVWRAWDILNDKGAMSVYHLTELLWPERMALRCRETCDGWHPRRRDQYEVACMVESLGISIFCTGQKCTTLWPTEDREIVAADPMNPPEGYKPEE